MDEKHTVFSVFGHHSHCFQQLGMGVAVVGRVLLELLVQLAVALALVAARHERASSRSVQASSRWFQPEGPRLRGNEGRWKLIRWAVCRPQGLLTRSSMRRKRRERKWRHCMARRVVGLVHHYLVHRHQRQRRDYFHRRVSLPCSNQ